MCDYSLQSVKSRDAVVGDELVVRSFGTGTTGFAPANDGPNEEPVAVCLRPGTELAFEETIKTYYTDHGHRTAIFRQLDKEIPHTHHDAVEFPDGNIQKLMALTPGQRARVLQLPAAPRSAEEEAEQTRAAYAG